MIFKALEARNKYMDIFQQGVYVPLDGVGQHQDRIVAIARPYRQAMAIAIVPHFFTDLVKPGEFPLGESLWGDTRLEIPQGVRSTWIDTFSEQEIPEGDTINIGRALQYFPISLLIGKNNS